MGNTKLKIEKRTVFGDGAPFGAQRSYPGSRVDSGRRIQQTQNASPLT